MPIYTYKSTQNIEGFFTEVTHQGCDSPNPQKTNQSINPLKAFSSLQEVASTQNICSSYTAGIRFYYAVKCYTYKASYCLKFSCHLFLGPPLVSSPALLHILSLPVLSPICSSLSLHTLCFAFTTSTLYCILLQSPPYIHILTLSSHVTPCTLLKYLIF